MLERVREQSIRHLENRGYGEARVRKLSKR